MDCDLGQPEFTPSGFLSLSLVAQPVLGELRASIFERERPPTIVLTEYVFSGPSFTHLHQNPLRMHYLGSTTPKDDPSFYIWAISDLLDQYTSLLDQSGASIPLVINTQGWYKGLGADLLLEIHRMAQPGKCFDFTVGAGYPSSEYDGRNIAANMPVVDPATETQVVPMQPYTMPENGPSRINASDLRMLQLISYFHLLPSSISTSSTLPSWDFSTSLIARAPYAVPFTAFQSMRIATSSTLSYTDLLRSLDVSIVALREEEMQQQEEQEVVKDPLQKAYERGFQQKSGRTLGLAIIRSIDSKSQHFHILTPVPPSTLERVNAIVKGGIEIPTVLMLDNPVEGGAEENGLAGVEWKRVPYLEYGENVNAGVGHGRRRVRRNVMRKSQFR